MSTNQNPPTAGGQLEQPPALPVYYMKLKMAHADARYGKLREGQVVAMDEGTAARYLQAGVADQASADEYTESVDRRSQRASARQEAFRAMNEGHAMWDVSTYRDVLTAPEGGLRLAYERGIPLVNVHMLRDEEGDPLPPDADIEEILDARQYLHTDLTDPFSAHDRSSVMGGGSPFMANMPAQDGPLPLAPQHRLAAQRINEQERYAAIPMARQDAQSREEGRPLSGRAGRAGLRARSMNTQQAPNAGQPIMRSEAAGPDGTPPPPAPQQASNPNQSVDMPAPPPPPPAQAGTVAPNAELEAKRAGADKPAKPASGNQVGNG